MLYQMIHDYSKLDAIKVDLYDIRDVLAHDRAIPENICNKLKKEVEEIYHLLNSYGGDEDTTEAWELYNEVKEAIEDQDTF